MARAWRAASSRLGEREVVGVGVAGALAGLGPDARALAHVRGRLLDRALLEHQLLADPVLEVEVGVVDAPARVEPSSRSIVRGVEAESVREEALRAR